MSLDVTLEGDIETEACRCSECGHEHERTRPVVFYTDNITHNLGSMAMAAGLYSVIWEPQKIEKRFARDLIPLLTRGLGLLREHRYEGFAPPVGYGTYEDLVRFVRDYLAACTRFPDAKVEVTR